MTASANCRFVPRRPVAWGVNGVQTKTTPVLIVHNRIESVAMSRAWERDVFLTFD